MRRVRFFQTIDQRRAELFSITAYRSGLTVTLGRRVYILRWVE